MVALPATAAPPYDPFRRLESLIDWERASRLEMRVDLLPQTDLMRRLGNPHLKPKVVHVAGTKGKGSVCALIDTALRSVGWRVGRYASPHIVSMHERLCMDGVPISDEELLKVLTSALDARDQACQESTAGAQATWFDVITAAAFLAFERHHMDWAVVEVGLGGLMDATNVVEPTACVITNIGLEHTDVLGPTVEQIAAHKAGIIKRGIPVVTGVQEESSAGAVIAHRAHLLQSPVIFADVSELQGTTQRNLAVSRALLEVLGSAGQCHRTSAALISQADLNSSLARGCQLPGRLERLTVMSEHGGSIRPIDVVLDGAHVDFALSAVLTELRFDKALHGPVTVVLALGADKDAHRIMCQLTGRVDRVLCTALPGGRPVWSASELAQCASRLGLSTEAIDEPSEAVSRAVSYAASRQGGTQRPWVLVTGSLYLVAAIRPALVDTLRAVNRVV